MKSKTIFFLVLLSALSVTSFAQTGSKDPVYLEVISNKSKTINYTAGVYPLTCKYDSENKRTTVTMYILNNGTEELVWSKNNHVLIVTKDNSLAYNYKTVAESGKYACAYTIDATKGFHEQTLCFDGNIAPSDIANVYLLQGGDIYKLLYTKGSE